MRPRLLDLKGGTAQIDEADWPIVRDLSMYVGTNGYVYFSTWEKGKSNPRTLHAFLMETPRGMHTDHINGDKLDNRRANLRVVTPSINGLNRRGPNPGNRSGVRGVSYSPRLSKRNPWRAQIMVDRKQRHLGMFATKQEAEDARRAAEAEVTA